MPIPALSIKPQNALFIKIPPSLIWYCKVLQSYFSLKPYIFKDLLNKVELLEGAGNMPGKWQLLIYLGQQATLKQQGEVSICFFRLFDNDKNHIFYKDYVIIIH